MLKLIKYFAAMFLAVAPMIYSTGCVSDLSEQGAKQPVFQINAQSEIVNPPEDNLDFELHKNYRFSGRTHMTGNTDADSYTLYISQYLTAARLSKTITNRRYNLSRYEYINSTEGDCVRGGFDFQDIGDQVFTYKYEYRVYKNSGGKVAEDSASHSTRRFSS